MSRMDERTPEAVRCARCGEPVHPLAHSATRTTHFTFCNSCTVMTLREWWINRNRIIDIKES